MTALAIDVRGLKKSFHGRMAVAGVSIAMPRGQVWGFLGPNGSGKTTTIRMLCGLLRPDEGEGACLGYDIKRESARIKRHVGYMTQRFSYWEDLDIRENLDFAARVHGVKNRRAKVESTLAELGLTKRAHQLAGELSGGWKQRLALAACTLHEPKLLLLDEPTAGVDPQARRDFWDEIHRLARAASPCSSPHYMDEAERCDRIVYISQGHMITQGTVAEVVGSSGLHTFRVEGEGVRELGQKLQGLPGVDHAAFFGAALHVSGRDRAALQAAIAHFHDLDGFVWSEVNPSLEDVFIDLMKQERARHETALLPPDDRGDAERADPDAPRPADLWHDDRHSGPAAFAVRLRDQHRSEEPSRRRACDRGQRLCAFRARRDFEHGLHPLRRGSKARRKSTACSRKATSPSSSRSPRASPARSIAANPHRS